METILITTLSYRKRFVNVPYEYSFKNQKFKTFFSSGALSKIIKPTIIFPICTKEVLEETNTYNDGHKEEQVVVIDKFKEEVGQDNVISIPYYDRDKLEPAEFFGRILSQIPGEEKVSVHVDFSGGQRDSIDMIIQFCNILPLITDNVEIAYYWYGEANHDTHTGELKQSNFLIHISELTQAMKRYVEYGDATLLKDHFRNTEQYSFAQELEDFSNALATCQINDAYEHYQIIQRNIHMVLNEDNVLIHLIKKPLIDSLDTFKENFDVGAVNWNYKNKNYQASLTILNETFFSILKEHVQYENVQRGNRIYEDESFKKKLINTRIGFNRWKNQFIMNENNNTIQLRNGNNIIDISDYFKMHLLDFYKSIDLSHQFRNIRNEMNHAQQLDRNSNNEEIIRTILSPNFKECMRELERYLQQFEENG